MVRIGQVSMVVLCCAGIAWAAQSPEPGKAADIDRLAKQLTDKDEVVRQRAASALGRLGAKARTTLVRLQELAERDSEEAVRQAARDAVERITIAAQREDADTRARQEREAAEAQAKKRRQEAVILLKGLNEKLAAADPVERQRFIQALAKYPAETSDAIPALEKVFLNDKDEDVQTAARKALQELIPALERPAAAINASADRDKEWPGNPVTGLFFSGNEINQNLIDAQPHFQRLHKLRTIRFNGYHLSARGLAALKDVPKLQKLYCSHVSLQSAEYEVLNSLTTLEEIWLWDVGFGPEGEKGLKTLVQKLPHLKVLRLDPRYIIKGSALEVQRLAPKCKVLHGDRDLREDLTSAPPPPAPPVPPPAVKVPTDAEYLALMLKRMKSTEAAERREAIMALGKLFSAVELASSKGHTRATKLRNDPALTRAVADAVTDSDPTVREWAGKIVRFLRQNRAVE